ncbi:TldD/PmbA family protein [Martelella alba]|uniref:TldD/PmbA family protein n=1 Tax=Martelella alba TaxID=2590451 RepID=A0A506UDX5_9HYPH|nr:metallopeptidase TldD-related protein [Martelella alba]TPW30869.1 TldD/PmbA family protein [Martelella alba]
MSVNDASSELIRNASRIVDAAKAAGADAADVVVSEGVSNAISVRDGKRENAQASENRGLSLRVFIGKRIASVSTNSADDVSALVERAIAMAKVSPEDPYACLADADRLADETPDLQLYDPTGVSPERLAERALAAEAAALAVPGVSKSSGASASSGEIAFALVTSGGFAGGYRRSYFSVSASAVAGDGTAMQRDHDSEARAFDADLTTPEEIGRNAGERAVARLNPRQLETQHGIGIIFDQRVATSLVGHLAGAISGSAIARKTSFLKDRLGKQVLKAGVSLIDDPSILRGSGSQPFDGEGVASQKLTMVGDGVLKQWFLSTALGRELGLVTNGRGVRSGNSLSATGTNLILEPGADTPEAMMKALGSGFLVTELIGHGVNMVTGEYSRGASGFWFENGEIAYPVSQMTLAGNLKDMYLNMTPASDIDRRYSIAAPSLLVEGLTLAGR